MGTLGRMGVRLPLALADFVEFPFFGTPLLVPCGLPPAYGGRIAPSGSLAASLGGLNNLPSA